MGVIMADLLDRVVPVELLDRIIPDSTTPQCEIVEFRDGHLRES